VTGLRQGATDLTTLANNTRRGFTDHEHLDSLGLIHMHGRVYDPTVGRFLSVDPLVRDAAASQSWNGYGYVEGRVLSATDPSGWQTVDCPQCVRYRADPPRSAWVTSIGGYWISDNGPTWRSDAGPDSVTINARTPMWVSTGFSWNGLQIVGLGRDPSGRAMPSQTAKEGGKEEPQSQQQCVRPPANRTFGEQAADFAVGFGDAFLVPIIVRNLAGFEGTTDYDSAAYGAGKITGIIEGLVPMALQGAAAYSAAAAARGAPSVLNANRYFRVGPGVGWCGTNVPRISSPFLPGDGHFSLTSRLPVIPPLGALFSAGGGCSGGK
jgi:RHS repeat-associated protein